MTFDRVGSVVRSLRPFGLILVTLVIGGLLLAATGTAVVYVTPADDTANSPETLVETDTYAEEIEMMHEHGITGDGVRVGIIGSTFDAGHEPIEPQVVSHRQLTIDRQYRTSDPDHDTAVAEVVAETAPESELVLVSLGSRPSATVYREAIGQLLYRDVDIILDAGSYFPQTRSDAEAFDRAVEAAREEGVVVLTSAGNYANNNWVDTVTENGWVDFDEDGTIEANQVGDGRVSGQLTLRLYWDEPADLELYLYRHLPDAADKVVAKSTDERGPNGIEGIDVLVPSGEYYVAVYAESIDDGTDVRLISGTQPLSHTVPEESVTAPGSSDAAISVAATDGRMLRADSSRGEGVAVSGPGVAGTERSDLEGTSAATSHVAGTVALVQSHEPELAPNETERELKASRAGEPSGLVSPQRMLSSIDPEAELPIDEDDRSTSNETHWTAR